MEIFGIVILGLVALIMLSYSAVKALKICHAFGPMIAICLVIGTLYLFGIMHLLYPGVVVTYIATAAWFIYTLYKNGKDSLKDFLNFLCRPAIVFFIAFSILVAVLFIAYDHYFRIWDVIGHWGPFHKALYLTGEFHIFYDSNLYHGSYAQGVSAFYYFFGALESEYSEILPSITINIAIFAGTASLFGKLKWKNVFSTILVLLAGGFFLYLFPKLSPYSEILVDGLTGVMFGALLMMNLVRAESQVGKYCALAIGLFAFAQIKDITLVLGLLVCLVFLALSFSEARNNALTRKIGMKKGWSYWILAAGLAFVLILSYAVWKFLVKQNADHIVNTVNMEPVLKTIKGYLFEPNGQQRFMDILGIFSNGAETEPIFMGDGISLIVILPIFASVGILGSFGLYRTTKNKTVFVFNIIMAVCAVLYICAVLLIYLLVFRQLAESVTSFSRYIATFFVAWSMVLLGTFLYYGDNEKKARYLNSSVAAIIVFTFLVYAQTFLTGTTYLYPQEPTFEEFSYAEFKHKAEWLQDHIQPTDKVLIISQGGTTYDIALYNYYALPYRILRADRGKVDPQKKTPYPSIGDPEEFNDPNRVLTSLAEMQSFLASGKAGYVLVHAADDYLAENYRTLFDDDLAWMKDGETALYKVNVQSGKETSFLELVAVYPE